MRLVCFRVSTVMAVVFLGLAVLLAAACGGGSEDVSAAAPETGPAEPAPEPAAPEKAAAWLEFASDVHGFSISTPGSFDVSRDTTQTEAGEIELTSYLAEMGRVTYGVVCNDFPEDLVAGKDPYVLIKGGSRGFVDQFGGTVTGERLLTLDGHPGMEVALTGSWQGTEIFAQGRFYLVGRRMHQAIVVAEKGSEDPWDIERFLASFKLI